VVALPRPHLRPRATTCAQLRIPLVVRRPQVAELASHAAGRAPPLTA
jgi:hypothetical protein